MQLTEEAVSAAESYWRARLAELTERTCWVADLRGERAGRGTTEVAVPPALAERLRRISRGEPDTLRLALAAGLVALLGRSTGDERVVIGMPADSETNPAIVLGCAPGGTYRELLGHLRDEVREALRFKDFPVDTLSDDPLYDVALTTGQAVPASVLFTVTEAAVRVGYDEGRFTEAGMHRIARAYVRLLDLATAEPDRALADLDLREPDDEAIDRAANDTARELAEDTIHGAFERQAAATPDAPALIGTYTYGELNRRANALARTLRERGVTRDRPVAVLAERSPELIVAILAVLKAGGAYLPVDPGYPPARIAQLLRDSGATIAVTRNRDVEGIDVVDPDEHTAGPDAAGPDPAGPGDLAYVIYTSGSTGAPKGVMVEHRAVENRLAWMQRAYPIGLGDVILQKTSVSFDVSVWELFWWGRTGAALALLEPGGEKDPGAIVDAVERHRVTTIHFVPSMLNLFLGHVERFGTAARLSSLRRIFTSGEALTPDHADRVASLLPGVRLINLYGPTEATVDVTHHVYEGGNLARVPIGQAIDNTRLYVLDEARRPVPTGLPGELYLAGAGLARGYLGRDDLTAERFVDVGGERCYRTGDRARRLPDGSIDFLGRVDQQVKVRGFRIEPGEIEHRLREHPAVVDVAVVPHDDGFQTSLRAYVVARGETDPARLRAFVREALPEYMVPSRVELLDALPLTPNGKLDRAALRAPRQKTAAPVHVAPRDDRERTLAGIWQRVLGVPRVGVHDNFFALGGNSIHFVSVLAAARSAGLDFTFQQLFRHQTVAALAECLTTTSAPARTTKPFELLSAVDRTKMPDDVDDAYPLSKLQAGLIFQTEVTGGLGQYHDVLGYLVRSPFDASAFEQAVRLMVRRHAVLRTAYRLTGFEEFVQVVRHHVDPPMTVVDLRDRTPDEQQRYNDEWVAAEKARPFSWHEGGLVSLHVQVLADDLFRYTVSQHNSALDGWSISLLHTQLFAAYDAFRSGRTPEPAPSTENHVRNFIALEREALRSAESRQFWLDVLDGGTPTEVPRRAGAVDTTDFEVVLHDVTLPPGITERVVALADSLSVPFKDVLLAAHVKVLAEVAGQREVLTGYEHSGRPELPGAEAALGLFLNTVPLRLDVGAGSWQDLIRDVYAAELDLLPHRRYPMAQMKHDAGARETLFETTFNYTHFYLLKHLHELPEFALLDLRVDSETEFVFRTEFSRHFLDDELRLCLHYHSHLFDPGQIERIGTYFAEVLTRMTDSPTARHDARPLLTAADRALLTVGSATEPVAYGNLAPAPVHAAPADAVTVARVAAVWSAVLDVPASELGPDSDFFALGGNSLSALRVVLELDGMVTLTDLNRHPRLADVARLVDQHGRRTPELLQLLSSSAAGARCALVCVPYPCGHPINFGPLAAELEELTTDVVVYGLEAPGHGFGDPTPFTPVADTAQLVADALPSLPVMLWGHCGGAAVTVELARQLEAAGHDLRHVFIGSKLLPTASDMGESIAMIESWTDEQIIRFMVDETGYTDLDGLDERHTAHMAAVFRHDVLGGYHYFVLDLAQPGPKIAAPLTFVVAEDDHGLAHYDGEYQRWGLVASDVRLAVLPSGGHYFVRANPSGCAALIEREVDA